MDDNDLPFTKEDYGNLREMMQTVKNMDGKLDTLATTISQCQNNCSGRRSKVDARIKTLETEREQREGAEKSTTRTAAIVAGVISTAGVIIGIVLAFWRGS